MNKPICILLLCIAFSGWEIPSDAVARQLDIFKSAEPFSIHFLFKKTIPDLERLETGDIDAVLPQLVQAEPQLTRLDERNLLYLIMGYLYLIKEEPERSLDFLSSKIRGNFILQDYRMVFEAQARILMAKQSSASGNTVAAVSNLEKASQLYLDLHRAYPASPYQNELPRLLAETEKQIGDIYFDTKEYRTAWQYYRKALMREFAGNETHQVEVHLALARTYEVESNLEEALDIYTFLLDQNADPKVVSAARNFLDTRRQDMVKQKLPVEALDRHLNPSMLNRETPRKLTARKFTDSDYGNAHVQEFYAAAGENDFARVFDAALRVLTEVPGLLEARGVISKTNQKIYSFVQAGNGWDEAIDRILHLYPPMELRRLGFLLWRNQYSEQAARAYAMILEEHPLEVESCHMALYFLGRIHEDLGDHERALEHYRRLLDQYNYGDYVRSAEFKIPWIHRLRGNLELAEQEFQSILDQFDPKSAEYENDLLNAYSFVAASHYWLAQTKAALNKMDERDMELRKLVELHPLSFYSMLARVELNMNSLSFVQKEPAPPDSQARQPGLGEMGRKHLKRAEKLIAIGLLQKGLHELSQVTHGHESAEFMNHLIQLFLNAGGYQRSISLSWTLSRRNNHDSVPLNLIETLFPAAYLEKAKTEAAPYKLDPYLVLALMRQESAFNPNAHSSADAMGLMQLIPQTAKRVARSLGEPAPGSDDLKSPALNIKLGVKYLNHLLEMFGDNPVFALAAYNAGPGKVRQWIQIRSSLKDIEFIESIPYNETRNYVKKVLRNYVIYKKLYEQQDFSTWEQVLTIRR
ncbi:lytic transglycosylase domain-containing protein [Nitrospina watsonii]|uniref:SLT domain-containing protein n=1 Tax=Nitrospina watsonii TaxID=1323948 RepID=A0ABM9HDR2_9BACT|nr:transglycosylase SLT domain-containing protein [Nitrospina watsonii]CAI2718295.1 SLT domain-containing protein [Nitrospina watsonii]